MLRNHLLHNKNAYFVSDLSTDWSEIKPFVEANLRPIAEVKSAYRTAIVDTITHDGDEFNTADLAKLIGGLERLERLPHLGYVKILTAQPNELDAITCGEVLDMIEGNENG